MPQDQQKSIMEKLLRDNSVKSRREAVESKTPERLDHVARTVQQFSEKNIEIISGIEKSVEEFTDINTKIQNDRNKKEEQYKKYEKEKREKMFYMFVGADKTAKVSSGSFSWRFKRGIRSVFNRGDTVYDKLDEKFTSTLSVINASVKVVSDTVKNVTKFLKNTVLTTFNCFKDILLGAFKFAWDAVDSLMTKLTGPVWDITKKVVSSVFSAFSWLWDVGKKMISFVWEGITTVFKVGYTVIAKAASVLYKGAKGIFQWWFKLLLNTIFSVNPLLWLVTVPLFIAISTVLFTVLSSSVGVILDLFTPIMLKLIDGGMVIFDWVWSGVTWLWKKIKDTYKGSALEKFVDESWESIKQNETVKKVIDYVNIGINWLTAAYTWLKEKGYYYYSKAMELINFFDETFLSSNNGHGYLIKALSTIGLYVRKALNNLPGFSKVFGIHQIFAFLDEKFGMIEGYQKFLDESSEQLVSISAISSRRADINRQLISGTMEAQAVEMLKSGKTIAEITEYLKATALPQFSQRIEEHSLDSESLLRSSLIQAQNVIAGRSKQLDMDLMRRDAIMYDELFKNIEQRFFSGTLSGSDKETQLALKKMYSESTVLLSNNLRTVEVNANKRFDLTDEINKQTQEAFNKKNQIFKGTASSLSALQASAIRTKEEFIESEKVKLNIAYGMKYGMPLVWDALRAGVLSVSDIDIDKNIKNRESYIKITNTEVETIRTNMKTPTLKYDDLNKIQGYKDGGVVFKNMKEPLDAQSLEYIRSKINKIEPSSLNININKKEKKPASSVITIIEESVIKEESYETYTLQQLSRGILGS